MLLFLLFAILSLGSSKEIAIPISKTKSGSRYLELAVTHDPSSKQLFEIDFNAEESYIDGSLFPEWEPLSSHTLQVSVYQRSKVEKLGELEFVVLAANISWIQHKGKIGLGENSKFIKMLESTFDKSIGLRFDLEKGRVLVEEYQCLTPHSSPFPVSISTWTTIDYMTPLTLNFKPSQDFLALLNSTQNNLKITSKEYNSKSLTIKYSNESKTTSLKSLLDCWSLDSTNSYECDVKVSPEVDVGLLLFSFEVKVCKNGVEIGREYQRIESCLKYLLIFVVSLLFFFLMIYLVKIKSSIEDSRGKYSYNPPSWVQEEVEDILAADNI